MKNLCWLHFHGLNHIYWPDQVSIKGMNSVSTMKKLRNGRSYSVKAMITHLKTLISLRKSDELIPSDPEQEYDKEQKTLAQVGERTKHIKKHRPRWAQGSSVFAHKVFFCQERSFKTCQQR